MTQSGQYLCFDKSVLAKSIRVGWQKKDDKQQIYLFSGKTEHVSSHFEELSSEVSKGTQEMLQQHKLCPKHHSSKLLASAWLYLIAWLSISRSKAPTKKNDFVIKSGAQGFNHLYDHWRLGGIEMRLSNGQNLVGSPITDSWVIGKFIVCWFLVLNLFTQTHSNCFRHRCNKLITKKKTNIELWTRPIKHYKLTSFLKNI